MAFEEGRILAVLREQESATGRVARGVSSGTSVGRGRAVCVSYGQFHYTVARFAPTVSATSLQFAVNRFQAGD